jgi:hypothetical protein
MPNPNLLHPFISSSIHPPIHPLPRLDPRLDPDSDCPFQYFTYPLTNPIFRDPSPSYGVAAVSCAGSSRKLPASYCSSTTTPASWSGPVRA